MTKILILGAAAGGGVPQWNCGCDNCRDARSGALDIGGNQASVAISSDGEHWFLINASPDLRQQIANTPALWPKPDLKRHSPIAGVILTNGEIDAITGLLTLREGSPFTLYAHDRVLSILRANSIFNALKPENVGRKAISVGETFALALPDGQPSGLEVLAFAAPGKTALFLEDSDENAEGDTLGLVVTERSSGSRMVFLAACAAITDDLLRLIDGADAVFFDGTLWRDDEMVAQGLSAKTGQRMGHIAMSQVIPALSETPIGKKFFLHINNSNPALRPESDERKTMEAAGWSIPAEGTEINL